jgi:hypothetical protein
MTALGWVPRASVCPCARWVDGEDVAVVHRLADADRDRLLADGDVEEAGQLAGPEALLDLLLEAPDQEHLPQEVALALLGQAASRLALDLGHRPESMLSPMRFADQWRAIRQGRPESPEVSERRILNQWRAIERASRRAGATRA